MFSKFSNSSKFFSYIVFKLSYSLSKFSKSFNSLLLYCCCVSSIVNTLSNSLCNLSTSAINSISKLVIIYIYRYYSTTQWQIITIELNIKLENERKKLEQAQKQAEQEQLKARENFQYFLQRANEINELDTIKQKNKEIKDLEIKNRELTQDLKTTNQIADSERSLKLLHLENLTKSEAENKKLRAENTKLKDYIKRLQNLFNRVWTKTKPFKSKFKELLAKSKEPKKYEMLYFSKKTNKTIYRQFTQTEYNNLDDTIKQRCNLIEPKKSKEVNRQRPTRNF